MTHSKEQSEAEDLKASTLEEAQKLRDQFEQLRSDNDRMNSDLIVRTAELKEKERIADAVHEQQRNTAVSQEAKAQELAEREHALKADRFAFDADMAALKATKAQTMEGLAGKQALVDEQVRDYQSKVTAFEKAQRESEEVRVAKDAELTDRESRVRAGEERLKSDAAAFAEERTGYEEKVRAEVIAELTKNVS